VFVPQSLMAQLFINYIDEIAKPPRTQKSEIPCRFLADCVAKVAEQAL